MWKKVLLTILAILYIPAPFQAMPSCREQHFSKRGFPYLSICSDPQQYQQKQLTYQPCSGRDFLLFENFHCSSLWSHFPPGEGLSFKNIDQSFKSWLKLHSPSHRSLPRTLCRIPHRSVQNSTGVAFELHCKIHMIET